MNLLQKDCPGGASPGWEVGEPCKNNNSMILYLSYIHVQDAARVDC